MKPALIEARDLNEVFFLLLKECWNKGIQYDITEGSNKGSKRLELCMASGMIHHPETRPLSPIMPSNIDPVTTDDYIQDYFVDYLMNPLIENKNILHYKYATWINEKYYNEATNSLISQLEWCIEHFKKKGYGNNHCFITIGDPIINFEYDYSYTNETDRRTSPCLRGIDIKIKENKTILGIIYRSWDLYSGFASNMGGFQLLNEYIANELSIESGPLTFYSQGLHCYDYQIKSVKQYLHI